MMTAAAMLIVFKKLSLCFMPRGGTSLRKMLAGALGDSSAVAALLLLGSLLLVLALLRVMYYVAGIRYILQQSWNRSICAAVVAMVGLFGVAGVYYYTTQARMLEQMRLTESLLSAIEEGNRHEVEQCLLRGGGGAMAIRLCSLPVSRIIRK